MDIYPSGIKVPNEPQKGFGKPVANKGYTPGTFGVTVDKKTVPQEMVSAIPSVGREVRNPRLQELLDIEKILKDGGFTLERGDKGITGISLPPDLYTQEELEDALGEKLTLAAAQSKVEIDILSKLVPLSGEYSNLHKETELLEGKLQNPATLAVLEQLSGETKKLIEEIKDKPLGTKLDELRQKISEFEKIVDRAKDEVAKIPVAPEPQIENEELVVVPPEESTSAVPETSPKTPERINSIPKFFEIGQTFLLPKDEDFEEAHWEVIELISKEGAMMMRQIDGKQKGRKERFYYKQLRGFLERIEKERQYGLKNPQGVITTVDQNTKEPTVEASKTSKGPSVLRATASTEKKQEQIIRLIGGRKINAEWTKGETRAIKGSEEDIQKTRAQTEVREKFEDMFTHDQKAFISLYTTASNINDAVNYTENETLRKHPYRDVIRQVFFANNIKLTGLTREEITKKDDVQKEGEQLARTALGYHYNPARDSAQAAGRTGIFSKPKEITSVGGMIQNSKTILKEAAVENPLRETILGIEKNPQEKLKRIASVLSTRIKNLSNNPNNLLKGKLSWIAFAVGGASVLTTGHMKSPQESGPVPVSESLNKNEKEIKDTWRKYYHFGKTHPDFAKVPEDISKLSVNQLKETLIQKYAKSYFDGTNNPRQTLLALGMFGDLVRDDVTKGTYDHLPEKGRAELSYLWDALNDVSMATSGEKLQAKTYEAAIEEVKQKVTNKEA